MFRAPGVPSPRWSEPQVFPRADLDAGARPSVRIADPVRCFGGRAGRRQCFAPGSSRCWSSGRGDARPEARATPREPVPNRGSRAAPMLRTSARKPRTSRARAAHRVASHDVARDSTASTAAPWRAVGVSGSSACIDYERGRIATLSPAAKARWSRASLMRLQTSAVRRVALLTAIERSSSTRSGPAQISRAGRSHSQPLECRVPHLDCGTIRGSASSTGKSNQVLKYRAGP